MVAFVQVFVVFLLSILFNEIAVFLLRKLIKKKIIYLILSFPIAVLLAVPAINISLPLQEYGTLGNALGTLFGSILFYTLGYIAVLLFNIFKK